MKITKLELKNFKRFDDLTIDLTSLAEPAKLVLLIGTNGSGKSSVFDAFEIVNKFVKSDVKIDDEFSLSNYYEKDNKKRYEIDFRFDKERYFHTNFYVVNHSKLPANIFYGRTSIRQISKLTRTSLGPILTSFEIDEDRPQTFIDRDNRFENDIEKVASLVLSDVFKDNASGEVIKERYIYPVNEAFKNIFGADDDTSLKLVSIKPPLDGNTAEILFEKGKSTIPYDYLSNGEKEVFNIILNLLSRRQYFQDAIYFLDEVDLHLNTSLQKNLLKEITENWIPDNCQFWTASHSLGFIDYANETDNAAIIDLDNLNFDISQVIRPSTKNNFDVFEIAVNKEFLSKVFDGKKIVFAENSNTSIYNSLNIDSTIFFNAKDKTDVFHKSKNNPNYKGLIDRDYLTDEERISLLEQYENLYILSYYSIENYYYHPDNLNEFYKGIGTEFSKEDYLNSLWAAGKAQRDIIMLGLAIARDSYPFYRENKKVIDTKLKTIRSNNPKILQMFDSEDFETFYKVFPTKDYGTQIKERQNLSPADLAKTQWFKNKIVEVLIK